MSSSDAVSTGGFITPANEAAMRAQRAIEQRRWGDAAGSVRKIPDAPLELFAWKALLRGAVLLGESRLTEALATTFQAAGCAFAVHHASDQRQDAGATQWEASKENPCSTRSRDSIRLAAMALTQAGKILRRLDRADEADMLLQTAFRIRMQHGSAEELWESSVELGLTADVARRYDEAASWFQWAIEQADQAGGAMKQLQAEAWGHLARSFAAADRHDEAVEAARRAQALWREHDAGAATALLADLRLAGTLLTRIIAASEQGEPIERASFDEVISLFDAAAEGLPAFGAEYQPDARWAIEQKHFAERLCKQSRS